MTNVRIKQILDMLDSAGEQLMSIPDDMFLSINPVDNKELEKVQLIVKFNDSLETFSNVASEVKEQIKSFFLIDPENEDIERESSNGKKGERIIKELDKSESHSIDEDFTFKRPYGFVFDDVACKGLKTWKSLYIQLLKELNNKNPDLFARLPLDENFVSERGNKIFSANTEELRKPEELFPNIFVETNYSAKGIIENIKRILLYFDIQVNDFKIYLREDRNA
ncbi:hypothetical protein [Seleniivibrio woodruffii]|uniref:hypothetical protein n=1 Tax=Seleniivibrio woodruffii TaxID=1078050 RepID=UPI0026EEB667|nr:hypothetical protein [Seleniivibrio woodruffii]